MTLTEFDQAARVVYSDDALERSSLFLTEMEHFLNCIEGREHPVVPLSEGVESLRIALTVKQSLKERKCLAI